MPLEFVPSQKGKSQLLHNGHLFGFHMILSGGKRSWKCINYFKSKCSAIVHTDFEDSKIVQEKGVHNHVTCAAKVGIKAVNDTIRQRARETLESPNQIVANVTAGLNRAIAVQLPSIKSLKRMTQRARQRENGAIPTNLLDLDIPDRYTTTLDGRSFLLHDSGPGNDRIVVFGTTRNLEILAQSQHWYFDGTFETAPPLFCQLYTLHAFTSDAVLPAVYALLPDKRRETYRRLFSQLRIFEPNLRPTSITTDFELASINAFVAEFPEVRQQGCFFHFCRCVWRKIQDVGLATRYETDEDFAVLLKMLPCLAFVPTHDVVKAFEILTQNDYLPAELNPIVDYVEDVWIGRQRGAKRRIPAYPLHLWNCYDSVVEGGAEMNGWCEQWHRGFLQLAKSDLPSIWNFIDCLQKDQSAKAIKLERHVSGDESPAPKKPNRNCSHRISRVVGRYSNDWLNEDEHLGLIDYLRGLAHNHEF